MTIRHPKTLGAGILLLVLALLAIPYTSITRTVTSQPEEHEVGGGTVFGIQVEEVGFHLDLRLPAVLGIGGVALVALAFLRRPKVIPQARGNR